ncbi:hypothetical protein A3D80_01960 [Candidatus Roizmanbacteria bacterium RIFCSPHIGHO2_02_FULL_40_13b]|uniref:Fido domain-containing protein n=1 Tax=Candidatus Roizmanbacteria bacterium RIFCSPHIGHO2_01_FULL_39_24 TaxID=1802032 RepID=A0A1F7GL27_9BACT|nr:MAG: hypothetical protein A2799_01320 [Candidatus Roizmanbacteria bacterium RIFCSPHIGHO2_01_FULL_39_24]OGK26893.1 MAG: hypothetical protein A3D80_01960 [Candidatus Roizmanbacteria bacterium RIFCSPHIGHO2_02_FULL_40_13b]OGK49372.1 MAG: hypothetical protein A3A56_03810 [Candidatus Roizmanbacteria bacterium RIFCSPLOWO2_01_FULL_40_32]OGK57430.1 MAG: hypothetical protein A3H83_01450 [Candidatus Roizmanbacteria bacterium RIFCSPLOWO2_02_FULL_39_8]
MKIPPTYTIRPELSSILSKIDQIRSVLSSQEIPQDTKKRFRQKSILKSSLFSARIEGNPLTIQDLTNSSDEEKKREVFNIIESVRYLDGLKVVNQLELLEVVKKLHLHVLNKLDNEAGHFRTEVSAIFNQAGVAVYMPPPPEKIPVLLEQLISFIVSSKEVPLIKAFITHLVFEKIHPFIDGNGRVGRLLIYFVLKYSNYDFGFYIPFEEYLDEHKEEYYYYLDIGMNDADSYLLFMAGVFLEQCTRIQASIAVEASPIDQINLPLRQEELYFIIKEHRQVSFDFIRRRFLKVPTRTLRYDLKKLVEKNYILKIGKTKGSWYKIK